MQQAIKETAVRLGETVAAKNQCYGSAFRVVPELLLLLYPNGIIPPQYQDMLLLCRMLDKCCRIATNVHISGEDAYLDIAGYGLLGHLQLQPQSATESNNHATDQTQPAYVPAAAGSMLGLQPDGSVNYKYHPPQQQQ